LFFVLWFSPFCFGWQAAGWGLIGFVVHVVQATTGSRSICEPISPTHTNTHSATKVIQQQHAAHMKLPRQRAPAAR
jgi:hypothetical protein